MSFDFCVRGLWFLEVLLQGTLSKTGLEAEWCEVGPYAVGCASDFEPHSCSSKMRK